MLGNKANATKAILKSRTGRKAAAQGAKGAFKFGRSDSGQAVGKAGAKGLGRLARGAAKVKAGKEAGRLGTKVGGKRSAKAGAKGLAKAGRGAGKYAAKKGKREVKVAEKNLNTGGSGGSRLLKFGLLIVAGLSIGALVGRLMASQQEQESSSSDAGSSGQNGSSSEGSSGSSSSASATASPDEEGQPRGHSDPSSGPLIGTDHEGEKEGVTEEHQEVEQRIRTRIGEDERTRAMPRPNIEVNGGVAELRGVVPSEDVKEAAGEIAAETEGVSEVRNLIEVNSEDS